MSAKVVPVERSCPACSSGIIQRGILGMKRVYLCESHRRTWDEADAKDLARTERGRTDTGEGVA